MTVIGLTGGIASGKSTASQLLQSLGAVIIDADKLGHRVYEPGTPGFQKVVNAFGHDIVTPDGQIDRRVLGGKVFGAPEEMDRLTAISWPEIRRMAIEEIAEARERDPEAIIVLEAAVLFEAGWEDLCDEVWAVTTKVSTAVERLQERNGLSEDQAMARIDSQMSNRERIERSDVRIDNSDDLEKFEKRIERQWKALQKRIPAGAARN
jgi:phosphopantetheine adenylyltransferase/dephospho-CoA kinase